MTSRSLDCAGIVNGLLIVGRGGGCRSPSRRGSLDICCTSPSSFKATIMIAAEERETSLVKV